MVNKIEVSCSLCDADYTVNHDLERPYRLLFCSFCGEELHDDFLEVDEYFEEEQNDEDGFND